MRAFTIILIACISLPTIYAQSTQTTSHKGMASFYWGYNRSVFSKSDLHFTGPSYDFTLYDVVAHDRPTAVSLAYINPAQISIPQYNARIGYFLSDRVSLSVGTDHMKYVVDENQKVLISGVIDSFSSASRFYVGTYLHDTVSLSPDFLTFEHSDGFNFLSLDVEYQQPLTPNSSKLAAYWNFGLGGVWIVTRTRVFVMEDGLDNDFHVSGFAMAFKSGPRLEYKKRLYLLFEAKSGYATLPWIQLKNAAPLRADQNIGFLEFYGALGYHFNLPTRR